MSDVSAERRPRVVVIGGGFGGLAAVRALRRDAVDVTLIDRMNHHVFQPLLYQVATAALNPSDIAYPIRSVLRRQENAQVKLADVETIDIDHRRVHTDDGSVAYDYLVVATGATHSYFGRDDWAEHAPGLKTVPDALDIRRRVLCAYEAAEAEQAPERRRALLTFVVVGAGPTGVELAGALSEIALHTLKRDFRAIDSKTARVILVEGEDRVLPGYPVELSSKAQKQLEKIGVEVQCGKRVTAIDQDGVDIAGARTEAGTVLWAAGVAGSPLARTLSVPLDRAGRVLVQKDLTAPGHEKIFVIGDLAALEQDGKWVPGVAPAAMQGGAFVAKAIRCDIRGVARGEFRYRDKGSLATIGRAAAVAHVGRFKLSGFVAWFLWWAVHVMFLIGFRSKLLVMFGWVWSYLTFQRGARLITGSIGSPRRGARRGYVRASKPRVVSQERTLVNKKRDDTLPQIFG